MRENATVAEEQATQAADDLDLLLRMTFKDENREDAEAALAEFFRRYQTTLIGFAEKNGFRALSWNPDVSGRSKPARDGRIKTSHFEVR